MIGVRIRVRVCTRTSTSTTTSTCSMRVNSSGILGENNRNPIPGDITVPNSNEFMRSRVSKSFAARCQPIPPPCGQTPRSRNLPLHLVLVHNINREGHRSRTTSIAQLGDGGDSTAAVKNLSTTQKNRVKHECTAVDVRG